jgi:outer membrane lipoprotein LolB
MNRRLACLGLLAFTAGCAHRRPGTDALSFAERREKLLGLEQWHLQGRIAVDTGDGAYQGAFRWTVEPEGISLTVRGPLGAGAVRVEGNQDQLIVTARGEQRELDDPESDLSALLGWWLPVQSLRYWLLGLPDPAYPADTNFDAAEVVSALAQRLWDITYDRYALMQEILIPQQIGLRHGSLSMRVTLDRFEAPALN